VSAVHVGGGGAGSFAASAAPSDKKGHGE